MFLITDFYWSTALVNLCSLNRKNRFIKNILNNFGHVHFCAPITNWHSKVQCLSHKCHLQNGSWRWQPLIAQVPAGKSKAILPLHVGSQLSKFTKKNNHVPYNMKWKCCPPSSIQFWHLFRKCAFTRINSISEKQSISRLILAFNSSHVWGFVAYTSFFKCPHGQKS